MWQQRRQLAVAAVCLLACTASNLAAPVLTGMLMETLVQQKPAEVYLQVRGRYSGTRRVAGAGRVGLQE